MSKRLGLFCLVATLSVSRSAFAQVDYPYRKASDFRTLESFKSVDDFEASYRTYVEHCLGNTSEGTGAVPCLIGYAMWDRELNIHYQKLLGVLAKREQKLLRESQRAWLVERDRAIDFNSALLDWKYDGCDGTMYVTMRAADSDEAITPLIKQRALLLRGWLEFRRRGQSK